MDGSTPIFAYGAAALLGVVSHVAYFNRSEHHLHAVRYMQLYLLAYATAVFILARTASEASASPSPFPSPHHLAAAAKPAASLLATHLLGLYASLLTYRATPLHPLHAFPGPFLARLTSFYLPLHVLHRVPNKPSTPNNPSKHTKLIPQAHKTLAALHARHGPIVRVGTAELSVADPAAVPLVYGAGSSCTKAPWYDNDRPLTSMHTARDRGYHDARRKVWGRAFAAGGKVLAGYERRVGARVEGLVGGLREAMGGKVGGKAGEGEGEKKEGVDAREWFAWFAYDVMGELAFGKGFGCVEGGKGHWAIGLLEEGMRPMGFMLPPWAFRTLAAIPGVAAGYWKFINYCSDQLEERMKTKPEDPDIMSALIEPVKDKQLSDRELRMLQADSRLIIVAGRYPKPTNPLTLIPLPSPATPPPAPSPTSSTTSPPRRTTKPPSSPSSAHTCPTPPPKPPRRSPPHRTLLTLPHLNALIAETLRLHPPVPSALQRLTPPAGLTLPSGTHIPGNTVVWCPAYVIGRSPAAYVEPDEFCPERWYNDDDDNDDDDNDEERKEGKKGKGKKGWVRDAKAYAPFGLGTYACVGKPLAMMELRMVVAGVVAAFEVGLAEGEDGAELLGGSADHFTLGCGRLRLCFRERERERGGGK
ncbi:cytochrome p450 [Diplodia corticola]|uniref:Cytochrome p450 n=1 Tax=Diplodia corticola TaxID=236234 RepID=A0A1J9RRC4_9PEZI|nr:cytochrome p450 [Diplodia corticola]OJD30452.1 cytochrome p450 [Diplodia corticola]